MERKLGDTITLDFIILDFTTGAAIDADSTPTCQIFKDDNDIPILTPIVVKRGANTGHYRVSVQATTGNGFSIGASYSVVITAEINGIITKMIIAMFMLDGIRTNLGARFLSIDTTTPNVTIYIYSSNLDNLITWNTSDLNGDCTFALLDGTYLVFASKVGYSFNENPIEVNLSTDATLSFIPIFAAFQSPQPAETCRVFAYCIKGDGITPMTHVTAKAKVTHLPFMIDDTAMISGEEISAVFDPITGMVYWDLIQGSTVLFSIKEVGLNIKKTVPAQETAPLTSL